MRFQILFRSTLVSFLGCWRSILVLAFGSVASSVQPPNQNNDDDTLRNFGAGFSAQKIMVKRHWCVTVYKRYNESCFPVLITLVNG
mmetsp:Transcript_24725/g.57644  ORF Transcript_24725/g.57644 Transcript_24725/m.57644 type:complete len:86 (-) Transcript_24725:180-437(-)